MQFLVIEGNIGAGKTTLAKMLADETNAKLILEQFEENPLLPKFYENQDRYSFPLELSFLADRFNQIKKELLNPDLFHSMIISDYFFSKTSIFARNTLRDDEYRVFRQIFNIISESIPNPDLYVYLNADVKILLRNIKLRGRDYEKNIHAEYLDKIKQGYFNYFKEAQSFPVLVVDIHNIDFVQNHEHYIQLKEVIFNKEYKKGLNRLIL